MLPFFELIKYLTWIDSLFVIEYVLRMLILHLIRCKGQTKMVECMDQVCDSEVRS